MEKREEPRKPRYSNIFENIDVEQRYRVRSKGFEGDSLFGLSSIFATGAVEIQVQQFRYRTRKFSNGSQEKIIFRLFVVFLTL